MRSLESIGVVVAVVAIEQQLKHVLTAELRTVHGLVHIGTGDVEQRIKRQGQPVLHVITEAGEMSTTAIVAIRIAAIGRADATTSHLIGPVWILIRRLEAEGWRWHDRESVVMWSEEMVVVVVRRQVEVILLLLGVGAV